MQIKGISESSVEYELNQLEQRHFIPAALMMEYRAGNLDHDLTRKIREFLKEDLCLQTAWLRRPAYSDIEVSLPINDDQLNAWHSYEDNASRLSPKRRIEIDKCVKASLHFHLYEGKSSLISESVRLLGHALFLKRFEAYARFYPNKIALRFNDTSYTYQQANARANQIAHVIIEKGTKKGDLVGIFLQRSPEWIIATLAAWKAGAAFVSIDQTIPAGSFKFRIQYLEKFNILLNETNLSCLITDSVLQIRVPNHNAICLDDISENISTENLEIPMLPCDLAYVMFTSGSTGKPKGVLIEHRGLVPCLEAHRECVDLSGDSVMAQYAVPGFDAWIAEMLILGLGGTLSIIPDAIRLDPDSLKKYCQDHKISSVIFTPHLLKQLGGPEDFPYWRALFIVGEKFGWDLARYWMRENLQVVNGYGLTETTICTTLENLNAYLSGPARFEGDANYIPIGRPILGTNIKLFTPDEKDLNLTTPSPIGIPGEMFISGISLTRGYYGEAEKNNEHCFRKIEEERFYRTGDKAICLEDGRFIVIGRYNRVFKFNSKRIDLDGLENILCKHPDVKVSGAACLADEHLGEEARLIVFLQSKNKDDDISNNDIQRYFNQEDIRTVGVPFSLIWKKDEFPKTLNGKKDYEKLLGEYLERKKLNSDNVQEIIQKSSNPSLNSLIDKIQSIWQSVLSSKSPFKLDANFFESGGSSVSVMFLLQQLRKEFRSIHEALNAALLFDYASIEDQAQIIFNLLNPMQSILLSPSNAEEIETSLLGLQYTLYCLPSLLGRVDWDYADMAKQLTTHCPALQLVGFEARDPSSMAQSIESIATDFVISLLNHHKGFQRPIFLMGWSTGGTLCIEVAKQLQSRGCQVFAYVIDALAPFVYQQLSSDKLSDELKQLANLIAKKCHLEFKIDTLAIKEKKSILEKVEFVFQKLQEAARYSSTDIQKVIWTAKVMRLAEQCYSPAGKLPGFCLFKAEEQLLDKIFRANNTLNWPSEGVTSLTIKSSNHFSILKDAQLHNSLVTTFKFHYRTCKISYLRSKLNRIENYIAPNVKILPLRLKPSERDNLPSISIREALLDFMLDSHKTVLFIQGESGIGKTTITTHLENILSPQLCKRIALDRFTCDELKQKIREMMSDWPLKSPELRVLILDGYDERMGSTDFNYYETNKLSDYENMKVIITCRSEYLKPGYHANFITDNPKLFEEWLIEGLTDSQVRALVDISVSKKKAQRYYDELSKRPELNQMTKNPLLLSFVLQGLKNLPKGAGLLNRFIIYRAFNQSYFERAEKKIKSTVGYPSNKKPYNQQCRELSQAIAATLYGKKMNNVCYKPDSGMDFLSIERVDDSIWKRFFSSDSEIFLKGCPINVKDYIYQFVHKSEMEYFVVDAMLEILSDERYTAEGILKWFKDKNLTPKVITSNESVLRFWKEGFELYPLLFDKLFQYIYLTRDTINFDFLGAVAITLLNMGFVVFSNKDFSRVRIPTAILDGAIIDNCDFTAANLEGVHLKQTWLRQSRFLKTNLEKIQFSEDPYLEVKNDVTSIAIDRGGKYLAIGSGKSIRVWNLRAREHMFVLKGHRDTITSLCFSNDGVLLASGSRDWKIGIWHLETKICAQVLSGHEGAVNAVSFFQDSYLLSSASRDGTVRLWDAKLGKSQTVLDFKVKSSINSVSIHPQINYFIAAGNDVGTLFIMNFQTQSMRTISNAHSNAINTLTFRAKVQHLVTGSSDCTIKIWNYESGELVSTLIGHTHSVESIAFSPDGQTLASGCFDHTIRIWDMESEQCIHIIGSHIGSIASVEFTPEGDYLITGSADRTVRFFNVDLWQASSLLYGTNVHFNTVTVQSNGRQLAYGSLDNTIVILNVATGLQTCSIKSDCDAEKIITASPRSASKRYFLTEAVSGHQNWIRMMVFSPDGLNLAVSYSKFVKILNIRLGKCLISLNGHTAAVTSIAYNLDGNLFVSGSRDGTVNIWDLKSEKWQNRFEVPPVNHLIFHVYEIRQIVIGCDNGIIIISDVDSGKKVMQLEGHKSAISSLLFGVDKKYLFSGGNDKTIRMWDYHKGGCLRELIGHTAALKSLMFTPDGYQLISTGADRVVRFWDLKTFECVNNIHTFSPVMCVYSLGKDEIILGLIDGDLQHWKRIDFSNQWILAKSLKNRSPYLCLEDTDLRSSVGLDEKSKKLAFQHGAILDNEEKITRSDSKKQAENSQIFFSASRVIERQENTEIDDDDLAAAIALSLDINLNK